VAMAYSVTGTLRYDKQHLVPGLEDHFTAGDAVTVDPATTFGLAVCKDLDYPALGRDYARAGARLLLVPAPDFDRDGWLHSRIAITRGVESGLSIARSADRGRLTATDGVGRAVADSVTGPGVTVATARLSLGSGATPYDRFGDWFAWLALIVAVVAVGAPLRRRRSVRRRQ
jgi:apolipoprotein N-acyltransferase